MMVAGPEIARIVRQFNESDDTEGGSSELLAHHEESNAYEQHFCKDVLSFKKKFGRDRKSFSRKWCFNADDDLKCYG